MIIKQINITNFGKLAEETVDLDAGLNVVYGSNESGKSTLQGFLLNMLFGMQRGRGKASKTDEFTRYEPLEASAVYSGSLTFSWQGQDYVLFRDFAAGKRRDRLLRLADGQVLPASEEDLSRMMGGLSRKTYGNMQSVEQDTQLDQEYLRSILSDQYARLSAAGETDSTVSEALLRLRARRKKLESEERRQLQRQEEALSKTALQIEYMEKELLGNRQELEALKKEAQAQARKQAVKSSQRPAAEKPGPKQLRERRTGGIFAGMILLAAAVILCFSALRLENQQGILYLFAALCAAAAVVSFLLYKKGKPMHRQEEYPEKEKEPPAEEFPAEELLWKQEYLRGQIRKKEAQLEEKKKQYEREAAKRAKAAKPSDRIKGICLAEETIENLAKQIRREYEGKFQKKTEQIYLYLTARTDARLRFQEDGEIFVLEGQMPVRLWQCSRGTRDLIALCLRLAAADMLTGYEPMPILLDDAFANFDDDRLKRTLLYLAHKKRQVILFTCQRRECQILEEMALPYHEVRWSGNSNAR